MPNEFFDWEPDDVYRVIFGLFGYRHDVARNFQLHKVQPTHVGVAGKRRCKLHASIATDMAAIPAMALDLDERLF